jgi:hypothetical protein
MASNNNINWNRAFDTNSSRQTPRNSSLDQYFSNQDQEPTPPAHNSVQQPVLPRIQSEQEDHMMTPPTQQQRQPIQDITQPSTPQQRPPIMDDSMLPPMDREGPPPVFDRDYVPGYLTSLIGRTIRAEFVIGNAYIDKAGKLIEVGVNYFVLQELNGALIMCDLYSVRFVNVLV